MRFRQAICNEIYKDWEFGAACQAIKEAGYEGIEIAPFTLAADPRSISADARAGYRRMMADAGLEFVGLHWLMVSPKGLHVTTPDAALREASWNHIRHLIDLCADLGRNGIMVFGSPQQRATTGGISRTEATRNFMDGLASVAPYAEATGVTILVEALPRSQCDVITTLAEAAAVVDEIGSPNVRSMFDTHNAADEIEPHPVVLDRYFEYVRHVHVNEMDGKHPGTGDYDFSAIFEVLEHRGYQHWISLEAFDFTPGADTIARESIAHIREQMGEAGA